MRYPLTPAPSKEDADALVALPKYIRRMPVVRAINQDLRIKTDRIYDSAGRPTGLTVDAHVSASGATRGETPRVCPIWRGEPIRCVDWHVRREFADGTVVEGWHEHLGPGGGGRAFAPPLEGENDLEAMFVCACQSWNITIMTRRDQRLKVVEDHDGNHS